MGFIAALASPAQAVRPFVTDDARVVGGKQAQVETWVQLDKGSFQHWILFSIGPARPLEFGVGAVYGADWSMGQGAQFVMSAPLLQAKFLFVEAKRNRWPGVAVEGGTILPFGVGAGATSGWRSFALVALTESLFAEERLLIHANLGIFHAGDFAAQERGADILWGIGAQLRTVAGLHLVGEVFSGNSYDSAGRGAAQLGLRYIFNDYFVLDATVGKGVWGDPAQPVWGTAGVHIVGGPW